MEANNRTENGKSFLTKKNNKDVSEMLFEEESEDDCAIELKGIRD